MSVVIAALALAAAQGAVPSDPLGFEIRCLMVAGELLEDSDPDVRRLGESASAFFLGRVDLRANGADLAPRMIEEATQMREEDRPALITACGEFMEQRGRAMEQTGNRMMESARGQR